MEWLKKDNLTNGVIVGLWTLASTYYLIISAEWIKYKFLNIAPMMVAPRLQLLMLFLNMLLFRWITITKQQVEKGRGVLLITFIMTIAYVYTHKVKI